MQLPAKSKDITIQDNTYKVTFPNNRQLMAIYSRKAQLSKEMYDSLAYSVDGNSKYVSMLIDAVATFENIMPKEFFENLNISITDLDVITGAQLVAVYRDQFEAWFNEWTSAIADVLKPQEEKKDAE